MKKQPSKGIMEEWVRRGTAEQTLYNDKHVLHELCNIIGDHLEELFDALGIRLTRSGKRYVGFCPIHGGTRSAEGLNMYPEGLTVKGWWRCKSKGCHHAFGSSLIAFTQGVLSHNRYGYNGRTVRKMVPKKDAVQFILDLLGIRIEDVKVDFERMEKAQFAYDVEMLTRHPVSKIGICTREKFRKHVQMPVDFYIRRHYSEAILDEYDVGLCENPASPMMGRVVVPVYDPEGEMVIGVVGRTLDPECSKCKMHHKPSSPCPKKYVLGAKWRTSQDFTDKNHLYNYWKAKDHIYTSKCVVIVEGVGDVWRLREAGIDNCVAVFGNDIQDMQEITLQSSGASNFIVVRDMDDAGKKLAERAKKLFGTYGRVFVIDDLPAKDVGDMTIEQVQQSIVPFVQSKMRKTEQ